MKTYYEIYPIEGWADKVSKSLKEIADDKNRPKMYSKTRKRYEHLANTLLNSLSSIAIILEENLLIPESNNEFDELASSDNLDILSKLQLLNDKFIQLEEFANNTNLHKPKSSSRTDPVPTNSSSSPKQSFTNNINNNKESIKYFNDILYECTMHNFGYSEINECAKLLYKWFNTRFISKYSHDFKYNIKYIPNWICYFIILYGKYHHDGRNQDFLYMINTWCENIISGNNTTYSIPYEIYKLDKTTNPLDCTIDAVVINDILSDGGMYKLSSYEHKGVINYEHDLVITVVKERNPSLHPKIVTRIARRGDLVREIGLTPVGGVN